MRTSLVDLLLTLEGSAGGFNKKTFEIVLKMDAAGSSFNGTYTDGAITYNWRGQKKKLVSPMTAGLRAHTENAMPAATPSLSIMDLITISTLKSATKPDGSETVIDSAQGRAGEYFEKLMIYNFDQEWREKLYGDRPALSKEVLAAGKDHSSWLKTEATPNFGLLLKNIGGSASEQVKKISKQKLEDHFKKLPDSSDYRSLTQKLYPIAYKDAVDGFAAYADDTATGWGDKLYEYITSDTFLTIWSVQVASQLFQNIKSAMYEFYTKLSILCPIGSDKPTNALTRMLAAILNCQSMTGKWVDEMKDNLVKAIDDIRKGDQAGLFAQDDVLKENLKAQQEILENLISAFDSVEQLADSAASIFTLWKNRHNNAAIGDMEDMDLANLFRDKEPTRWEKIKAFGSKVGTFLKVLAYAAAAGAIIYLLVGGNLDVVTEINLGLMATGFVIKFMDSLIASRLGGFLTRSVAGMDGWLGNALKGFKNWFTKAGVVEANLVTKILGKSSAEFMATRLGPALAVLGVVVSAIDLAKAIDSGLRRNIVFESINLVVAVVSLVFIGLELMSFAWAGPVGLVIAFVGALVALIQMIWNIFDPPKPKPTPIEEFIAGPLTPDYVEETV